MFAEYLITGKFTGTQFQEKMRTRNLISKKGEQNGPGEANAGNPPLKVLQFKQFGRPRNPRLGIRSFESKHRRFASKGSLSCMQTAFWVGACTGWITAVLYCLLADNVSSDGSRKEIMHRNLWAHRGL